jgi:hypothetical protein
MPLTGVLTRGFGHNCGPDPSQPNRSRHTTDRTVGATAVAIFHPPSDPDQFGQWVADIWQRLVLLVDTAAHRDRFNATATSIGPYFFAKATGSDGNRRQRLRGEGEARSAAASSASCQCELTIVCSSATDHGALSR